MHVPEGRGRARLWAVVWVALLVIPTLLAAQGPDSVPVGPAVIPPALQNDGARAIDGLAWPMFGQNAQHTANAGAFARKLTEPMLKWSTQSALESRGMAVGNFTGNILLNQTPSYDRGTLHAVYAENGLVVVAEATTGTTMWQAPLGGTLLAAPALADFDQNGRLEIVVVSSAGNVSCYEPVLEWNGSAYNWSGRSLASQRKWDRSLGAETGYTSPAIGDVSGDGVADVVLCAGRNLDVLHGQNGTVAWNVTLPGNIATSPVLVRYGTGGLWVAAQSFNTTIVLLERTYFSLFNDRGQESWTKSVALSSGATTVVSLPSPAAADLNGDGFAEMVFLSPFESGTGRVYAYKQDGTTLWNPFQLKGQAEAPPALGDLNADSVLEVVTAAWNYSLPTNARIIVTAVDGRNGTEVWTKTIDRSFDLFTERAAAGPALADLDSDNATDVVLAAFNGRIYGLGGRTGAELWEYNSTRVSLLSAPSVADSESDGFPEIFVDGLVLAQKIAELSVSSGDISFSAENPSEGDAVSVSAFIKNNGTKSVTDVKVRFSDIYDNLTAWTVDRSVNVSAGGSAGATVGWTASGGGRHLFQVEVDPGKAIEERTKDNNQASRELSVLSHYTLSISCSQNESYLNGGEEAVFLVNVKNEGDVSNPVSVNLTGAGAGWTASVSTDRLTLDAGKSSTVTVRVRSPAGATAGAYPVSVTARSEAAPGNRATVTLTSFIRGQHGVSMTPRTIALNCMADDLTIYSINVTNTGNSDDTILFSNSTPPQDWLVFINQPSVDLPAGSSMILTVIVRPPPPAGEGAFASVDITAENSADPSARAVVTTLTTVVLPDLVVKSIRFLRRDGVEADGTRIHLIDQKDATVSATVRNIRDNVDIQLVKIDFMDGPTAIGSENIGPVPAGLDGRLAIPWRPAEGLHDIQVTVDPAQRIRESNEDNNALNAAAQVKNRSASTPYTISGTITREGGTPASGATVAISNFRTGQTLSLGADASGRYTGDLAQMAGGYEEEEAITVTASDGLTTCSTSFFAYSEDGGKQVDLALLPGKYDLHLTVVTGNINTDPAAPAVYKLWITNLGAGQNTVLVNYSTLPSQWNAGLEDSSGARTSLITLPPAGSANATDFMLFKLTPPSDARAGSRAAVRVQATSVNDSGMKRFVDTTTTVNQLFLAGISAEKGKTVRPSATVRCNFTVHNRGNGNDSFDLSVAAAAGLSAALDQSMISLGPFTSQNIPVNVTAGPEIAPGAYNITLQARSRFSPAGAQFSGGLSLEIESFRYGVQMTQGSGALRQEDFSSVNFTIRNTGNSDDLFSLFIRPDTPANLSADWGFSIRRNGSKTASVSLAPGEIAALAVRVEPPREISGLSRVMFNVSAFSETDLNVSATTMVSVDIERPDLLFIGSGIRMSPAQPGDGQLVRLKVTVLNQGFWDSPRVAVSFFVDGKAVGDASVPPIPMAGQLDVTFNWTAKQGSHTIKAVVNPDGDGQARELTYQNNEVTQNAVIGTAGPEVTWWIAGAFAVVFVVVLAAYFALSRKPAGRRKRPSLTDEEAGDAGENEEDEEGEEEQEETPEEEEEPEGSTAENAGDLRADGEEGESGAVEVEAIEVVDETERTLRPRTGKSPPKKKKRPPLEPKEVDMPTMMRIG